MPGEFSSPGQMKAGAPATSSPLETNAGTQAEDALTEKVVSGMSEVRGDGALSQGPRGAGRRFAPYKRFSEGKKP